ncbi:hypothetical protein WAI453_011383 [Rhynchosporium graminicola]
MQTSQNRALPREVEDRRRGSKHYYSDVYENPDQLGVQRSPVRETAPRLPQHQVPIEPGIPIANNASYRQRGAGEDMSRPPSYSNGAPHEELLNKTNEAIKRRQEQQQLQQRQLDQSQQQAASRRQGRGYRRTEESGDQSPTTSVPSDRSNWTDREVPREINISGPGSNQTNPVSNNRQSLPNTRTRADPVPRQQSPRVAAPQSAQSRYQGQRGPENGEVAGETIPRLQSPSVMSSVLKPLNGKIMEYNAQMDEAQKLMDNLDSEILALQSRRLKAEQLHLAAKTKHDDYRRQYQGVERAMRGEPEVSFSRLSVESERPNTQQTVQTAMHAQQQQQQPQQQRRENQFGGEGGNPAMRSRTESWNSMGDGKRESKGFKLRNIFGS